MKNNIIEKERGFTLYGNGVLLNDDNNDFVFYSCLYIMEKYNITLVGVINSLKSDNLFYGKSGWTFKIEPPIIKKTYFSNFSNKWKEC